MADIDYQKLAEATLKQLFASKAVGSPDAVYGHGPGGLFSAPGLDPQIFNAMLMPQAGLEAKLPVMLSNYIYPLYGIVTGQTATTGSEPSAPCEDWPVSGLTKLCMTTAPLGKFGRSSRTIDLSEVGSLNDRSDFRNFTLAGDAFANAQGAQLTPSMLGGNGADFLNNEVALQMRELRVAMARDFAPDFYTSNPSSNVGSGGRSYWRGLDLLINTGYRDAETGVACPASDSIVESFGNVNVSTTGGASIVQLADNIWYRLQFIVENTGIGPVQYALSMRPALFEELTAVWPCSYLSTRCSLTGNSTEFVDAQAAIDLRNQMRDGSYLLIHNVKVPVVQDPSIAQTELTPGVFSSSIYFVPLTVLGRVPSTYVEYFNFAAPGAAQDFISQAKIFGAEVLDQGKFLATVERNNTCFKVQFVARKRIVMRTPYAAARITNVAYQIYKMERSPFPTDPYFVNGGSTSQPAPSYYTATP